MKTMVTWSAKPGCVPEAVRRFLAGMAGPDEGVTILGRWHSVDMSIGFTLSESDSPAAHYAIAAKWADIMDLKTYLVIEDSEVGPLMAAASKK